MNQVKIAIKKEYTKTPLNYNQMIELLESRWLDCGIDKPKIINHLQNTWYYRLSAYFKTYQNQDDSFYPWITFNNVRQSYVFDRKLRLLTLDAIEKIEVSLKSNMNDIMSQKWWAFRYLDNNFFDIKVWSKNESIHTELMNRIKKLQSSSRENIKYYHERYKTNNLPSRILFQELSLWEVSNMYNLLKQKFRQEISDIYWVYERDFKTWIQSILNIRNICAHHWRLRNRRYVFKVRSKDTKFKTKFQKTKNQTWFSEIIPNYYNIALIIAYLLRKINKNFSRKKDLKALLKKYKNQYNKSMWFYSKREKRV